MSPELMCEVDVDFDTFYWNGIKNNTFNNQIIVCAVVLKFLKKVGIINMMR